MYHIIARVAGVFLLLVCGLLLAVQRPAVQERIKDEVTARLESGFNGKLQVGEILVQPFNAVMLKDVVIIDDAPFIKDEAGWVPVDTLFKADIITATLSLRNFVKSEGLHFGRIFVEGSMLHIVSEPGERYHDNMSRIFQFPKPPQVPVERGNVFDASKVRVRDFRFRLSDAIHPSRPHDDGTCINWQDLDLRADLDGHNLRLAKSRVSGVADRLSVKEKCGYRILKASGRAKVGMGKTEVKDFRLKDEWSEVRFPLYTMNYANAYAFRHFLDEVRLGLKISRGSLLSMRTMHAFTSVPRGSSNLLSVEGSAQGYVNDLKVNTLKFTDIESGVSGTVSGSAIGLPAIDKMMTDVSVKGLTFTTSSLERFVQGFVPGASLGLKGFAPGRTFTLDASASGRLDKLAAKASLASRIGSVNARMNVLNLLHPDKGIELGGTVGAREVQMGTVLNNDKLGACTLHGGLRARFGKEGPSVIVDSLLVDKLGALGYDYSDIAAAGRFSGSAFDGKLVCDDPNLNFIFQGIFNLSRRTSNALYKFYANLGYADLQALNLFKGGEAKISAEMFANFMRIERGDLIGDIDIRDFSLENEEGSKNIGDISIGSHSNDNIHRIQFNSSFADGGYVGSRSFIDLLDDIQTVTTRRDLPALYKSGEKSSSHGTSELEFNFHDSWDLISYLVPGLYIADGTALKLKIDSRGVLNGSVTSPRLAYGQNYFKGFDLRVDNLDRSLNCIMTGKEIRLARLGFKDSALTAYAEDNNFALGFHYDNITGEGNLGEIYLTGDFSRDATDTLVISAHPLYSYIKFNGEQWDIAESEIRFRAGDLSVNGFAISNGAQRLSVDGGLSRHRTDTLGISLSNFDLSNVDNFLVKPLDLAGSASGSGMIYSPTGSTSGMTARLDCRELSIAGNEMGDFEVSALWDAMTEEYDITAKNVSGGEESLYASAYYSPSDRNVDASVTLTRFGLAPARPFLSEVFDDIGGSVSGVFTARGSADSLTLGSYGAELEDVYATVGFTGATYTLGGPFYLEDNGIFLEEISISDERGGTGSLFGSLDFGDEPALDVQMDFENLQLLNAPEREGSVIYGQMYASGSIKASGPFDALNIDIDATSSDEGKVHVPLNGYAMSSSGKLLSFKQPEKVVETDPYEERMGRRDRSRRESDLSLKARVNATEDLEALIEIDKGTGNVMAIRGNGLVNLEVRPAGDVFTINGDYSITSGQYHFVALGIANKDFTIQEGSSIKFNGDLLDSELDVNALHTLKTSLSTLLSDTTSVSTRRTVECGIRISDKIVNPRLDFSINIPDLDPTTRSLVESALNTEDKIQRQFVGLLLTGTFLPAEASGIVNNSEMLFSNVSEIMSNQLNNILQKLDIPLDLGLGYHPNEGGTDIFDVAVSTQLFNNRVVVNGTIGNRQYSTTTNPNGDVVGDLDIEVKLDKPGKFRLNLFSHSADEYTSYLDYTQRNGIGIAYQKEFNTLRDFFRDLFTSKRRKEEMKAAQQRREDEHMVIIDE